MADFSELFVDRSNDADDYYSVLGCDESSSVDQIIKEYHIRARECHPDKGGKEGNDEFRKITKAKEILTDKKTRDLYNTWRRGGIPVPFDEWLSIHHHVKGSMHFVSTDKQLTLEGEPHQVEQTRRENFRHSQDNRDNSPSNKDSILNQFRSYKI
jgi:DnaJ family protein C protein 12